MPRDPTPRVGRVSRFRAERVRELTGVPVAGTLPPVVAPPVLLRSLSAAVLTDGSGELTLPREARGAVDDWGGVYAQLVRLTGPWRISLYDGVEQHSLRDGLVSAERRGDRWRSEHCFGRLSVFQEIAPTDRPAGAIRRLRFEVSEGPPLRLVLDSEFVPYLLPTLVEGIRPTTFRLETSATGLALRQRGFALSIQSSVPPSHLYVDRASWLGGHRTGPIGVLGTDHELVVGPGEAVELRCVIAGGLERDLHGTESSVATWLGDPEPLLDRADAGEVAWVSATPVVRFPDAPELERGYAAARASLRRLYCAPDESLTGLVAGYPWYSAIWGRDLAWMLPALLWLGDFDWVARSLTTMARFQSRSKIPLLGGEPGELPMQVAPGPIFLYGTSDTTLYYPEIVERLVRHSGDPTGGAAWLSMVRQAVEWGISRTDPTTGLLRNGGEAEEISAATGGLARVRYGIDSPDTTIWDSADRRDHAIDVQVLWHGALAASLALDRPGPAPRESDVREALAARIAATISSAYRWPEERYLVDTIRSGRPVRRLRPNALRVVSAGLIAGAEARAIVRRAAEDDLTAPWGVRTLSTRDPMYRPDAYHDGQVWTIATAWAADAALAAGETDLGIDLLKRIAARYDAEDGHANECYRGDRPDPFNSCFLLGLSVGPFVSILFDRLWGLRPDGRRRRLELRPRFPVGWSAASIEGLRLGPGVVTLRYHAPTISVEWSGPGALELAAPGGIVTVAPGGTATVPSGTPTAGS